MECCEEVISEVEGLKGRQKVCAFVITVCLLGQWQQHFNMDPVQSQQIYFEFHLELLLFLQLWCALPQLLRACGGRLLRVSGVSSLLPGASGCCVEIFRLGGRCLLAHEVSCQLFNFLFYFLQCWGLNSTDD